jgi:hypothetical protein
MSIDIKTEPPVVRMSGKENRASGKNIAGFVEVDIVSGRILRGFFRGISSLTFIQDIPSREYSLKDAWLSVGSAFQSVGDNIRKAMYEQPAPARKKTE